MTKLDILDTFEEIKIGVEYQLDEKRIPYFPGDAVGESLLGSRWWVRGGSVHPSQVRPLRIPSCLLEARD